jgi:hypothetical protein
MNNKIIDDIVENIVKNWDLSKLDSLNKNDAREIIKYFMKQYDDKSQNILEYIILYKYPQYHNIFISIKNAKALLK